MLFFFNNLIKKPEILMTYFYCLFISFNTFYTKHINLFRIAYFIIFFFIFICSNIELFQAQDVPSQDTSDQHRCIVNFTSEDLIKRARDLAIERYDNLKEKYDNCTDDAEKEVLAGNMAQTRIHVEMLKEECAKYDNAPSTSHNYSNQK